MKTSREFVVDDRQISCHLGRWDSMRWDLLCCNVPLSKAWQCHLSKSTKKKCSSSLLETGCCCFMLSRELQPRCRQAWHCWLTVHFCWFCLCATCERQPSADGWEILKRKAVANVPPTSSCLAWASLWYPYPKLSNLTFYQNMLFHYLKKEN